MVATKGPFILVHTKKIKKGQKQAKNCKFSISFHESDHILPPPLVDKYHFIHWHPNILVLSNSDGTAEEEAEALTRDLFGCKRKQLNETASTSRYYVDYTVL